MMQQLPFDFSEPNPEVAEALKRALAELPIVDEAKVLKARKEFGEYLVCDLQECVALVMAALEADHRKNLSEKAEATWTFAYRLEPLSREWRGEQITGGYPF